MAMVVVAGCTGSEVPAGPVTKVSILTGFDARGHEAYFEVAKAQGFFAEAGLDVTIQQGKGTIPNATLLQAGNADFAVLDIAAAQIAFAGTPGQKTPRFTDFTIVSAIHQRSLSAIASLEGYGITTPKDLNGKTIGFSPGGSNYLMFPAYAALAGIDYASVKWRPLRPDGLMPALAAHQVDATVQVIVGKPAIEAATKRKAVMLPYNDQFTDAFGNGLATSRRYATDHPDVVRRVNQAVLKGLEYAVAHPQEAGAVFNKAHPEYLAKAAAEETRLLEAYVRAEPGKPSGWIDQDRMAKSIALLDSQKLIAASFLPDEIVSFDLMPQPGAKK
jgi:NitT/TauT family transport system substrate-binding protein